jgi:catechol 2,3-dioxygenase-like lactoylglutathione lyase family enzyme
MARRLGIHSVNRFVYSVPKLDEAEKFYKEFGLDARREGKRLDLYTFGNPHCWASVHESGKPKKFEYLSFGIFAQDVPAFQQRIQKTEAHPLGDNQGLWTHNPDGVPVQFVVAPKVSPSAKCKPIVEAAPVPGKGAAPSRSKAARVRPRCLSHVLFFTPDVPRMMKWSEDVLGLRLTDKSLDVVAFMHGAHGSDHHLVAFAKSNAPGLHHSSWDVGSLDEVGRGSEQMRNAGYSKGWGVGRHVLGSNYFYYVRDPWGSYAEYSFDIDYVPAGVDWPMGDHPPEDSLYVWGPTLPEDFIQNFEAA